MMKLGICSSLGKMDSVTRTEESLMVELCTVNLLMYPLQLYYSALVTDAASLSDIT